MKGSNILIGLMSLTLVVLVGLIIFLLANQPQAVQEPPPLSTQPVQSGGTGSGELTPSPNLPEAVVAEDGKKVSTAKASEIGRRAPPPARPKPIANKIKFRQAVKQGRTYETTLKLGFVAKVSTEEWGVKEDISMTYLAEMRLSREIEVNDGERIVELRHIQECRNAKLLAHVDNVSINLGYPGVLALGIVEDYLPGTIANVETVQPFAEEILKGASQYHLDSKTAKAVDSINSLSGKKVRIEYVDGKGVVSLEPVGCSLTQSEFDYLSATAVLSDCYIFPEVDATVGDSWDVEASQLAGLLDPTLRGRSTGVVRISRNADETKDGHMVANLNVGSGTIRLDSSDHQKIEIATFTPRGTLHYVRANDYICDAELTGDAELFQTSKDHILFKTEFRFEPQLRVKFSCKLR